MEWFVVPLTEDLVRNIAAGKVFLRDVLRSPDTDVVRETWQGRDVTPIYTRRSVIPEDITDDKLPEPDVLVLDGDEGLSAEVLAKYFRKEMEHRIV